MPAILQNVIKRKWGYEVSVVYVRYGGAVSNSTDAISLLVNGMIKARGAYVRFDNERWENGEPVGCELTIEEVFDSAE